MIIKKYNPKLFLHFEYAGYNIKIYPKKETENAMEFFLFDTKDRPSRKTLWIPKRNLQIEKRDGEELLDINWLFDDYKNREKLEQLGYGV